MAADFLFFAYFLRPAFGWGSLDQPQSLEYCYCLSLTLFMSLVLCFIQFNSRSIYCTFELIKLTAGIRLIIISFYTVYTLLWCVCSMKNTTFYTFITNIAISWGLAPSMGKTFNDQLIWLQSRQALLLSTANKNVRNKSIFLGSATLFVSLFLSLSQIFNEPLLGNIGS